MGSGPDFQYAARLDQQDSNPKEGVNVGAEAERTSGGNANDIGNAGRGLVVDGVDHEHDIACRGDVGRGPRWKRWTSCRLL